MIKKILIIILFFILDNSPLYFFNNSITQIQNYTSYLPFKFRFFLRSVPLKKTKLKIYHIFMLQGLGTEEKIRYKNQKNTCKVMEDMLKYLLEI